MKLWTDYEGRTIAGAYPLEKLLSPEGRSAFFSTHNGTGNPAVIRLIEAHFDEAEILARWRQVAEINQENLVTLRKYGQTVLDGTALVFAVLEPTEANLADVLKERPLTLDETRQVATSLIAALETLHSRNLIHEHIEPANVLAVGEVIKLRSDCIREAPEGQEGADLKARDVHDLAVVLLQSLTLQRTIPGGTSIPAPFSEIIRNGISGVWGLGQIAAVLAPTRSSLIKRVADATAANPSSKPTATAAPAAVTPTPKTEEPVVPAPTVRHRIVRPVEPVPSRNSRLWIVGAIGALIVLLIGWRFMHTSSATASSPKAPPISTLATVGPAEAPTPSSNPAAPEPSVATPATVPDVAVRPATDSRAQWRVVAYTYNRQDQAQQKADLIARQHAALRPEVFSPNGRAPYLVTVGGPMTRDEADALKRKARAAGLPRDLYVQNYTH